MGISDKNGAKNREKAHAKEEKEEVGMGFVVRNEVKNPCQVSKNGARHGYFRQEWGKK